MLEQNYGRFKNIGNEELEEDCRRHLDMVFNERVGQKSLKIVTL